MEYLKEYFPNVLCHIIKSFVGINFKKINKKEFNIYNMKFNKVYNVVNEDKKNKEECELLKDIFYEIHEFTDEFSILKWKNKYILNIIEFSEIRIYDENRIVYEILYESTLPLKYSWVINYEKNILAMCDNNDIYGLRLFDLNTKETKIFELISDDKLEEYEDHINDVVLQLLNTEYLLACIKIKSIIYDKYGFKNENYKYYLSVYDFNMKKIIHSQWKDYGDFDDYNTYDIGNCLMNNSISIWCL